MTATTNSPGPVEGTPPPGKNCRRSQQQRNDPSPSQRRRGRGGGLPEARRYQPLSWWYEWRGCVV